MKDTTFGFLTEEARKLHEEFRRCQNEEEIQALIERENRLNESRDNNEIPHLDMTYEEFLENYECVDSEEINRRYGI